MMYEDDDGLRQYLQEVSRHALLLPEEEVSLGRAVQAGRRATARLEESPSVAAIERAALEREAREGRTASAALVRSNLRLVISVAKRYVGLKGQSLMDLIQEGNLGLLQAVERFDPERGTRFSTYGIYWIRQAIRRSLDRDAMRIPEMLVDRQYQVQRVTATLTQTLGRVPTPEEIALEVDFTEIDEATRNEMRELLRAGRPVTAAQKRSLQQAGQYVRELVEITGSAVSLETPIGSDEDSELSDTLPDETEPGTADAGDHEMLEEMLVELLLRLEPRDRQVIELRYGLNDGISHSLEEVARLLGTSRERIRQIEGRTLRKLRHPSFIKQLRDFYVT